MTGSYQFHIHTPTTSILHLILLYPSPSLLLILKAQLTKSNPQSVHQHYEEILQGVREKTGFASQQLMATAQKADQSIRYDSC